MTIDSRGSRAGAEFRRAVDRLGSLQPDVHSFDRFERVRARKHRNRRIGAGLLALAVAAAALVLSVQAFGPLDRTKPATPNPPGGVILYGRPTPRDRMEWFTVRPDGTATHDLGIEATCAVWFPDGSRILITNDEAVGPGTPLRPAVVDPDGSNLRPLDLVRNPVLHLGCGEVSPDGTTIVLEGFGKGGRRELDGIYTVRASDGGGLVPLIQRPGTVVPRYSPDGTQVIFFDTRPGVSPMGAGALFVMGADGSDPRRITSWGDAFMDFAWSPDGAWILFQKPYGQLYLVRPDGSDLHRVPLVLEPGEGALGPSWSPDGKWIVFSQERADRSQISMVRPDGTGLRIVTGAPDLEAWYPDWGPS